MKYTPEGVTLTINGQEVLGFADNVSISIGREVYTVYGKEKCDYCEKAKTLLESKGLKFEYKEVGIDISLPDLQIKCQRFGITVRTVPQIFKSTDDSLIYIGGYTDLIEETI